MIDYELWYKDNENVYQSLEKIGKNLVENILVNEAAAYALIESRVKSFDSFVKKMKKKNYTLPKEMSDLVGVRIVGSVISDVNIISDIIEHKFDIDWNRSSTEQLEHRSGYRGKNYVVTLREDSIDLKEHERLKDLHFEIQVTTLLDYAWGQIEHDRNYKTVEELPKTSDIPRRFRLISGTLEILDNEFERLSKETERYADTISNKISIGDLDMEISPLSLRKYLTFNFDDLPGFRKFFIETPNVLDELASMEIRTIAELNAIIPEGFKEKYKQVSKPKDLVTFTAIIRDVLIIHNSLDYFRNAWKHHYNTFDYHSWKVYKKFNLPQSNFPPESELRYNEGNDDDD